MTRISHNVVSALTIGHVRWFGQIDNVDDGLYLLPDT